MLHTLLHGHSKRESIRIRLMMILFVTPNLGGTEGDFTGQMRQLEFSLKDKNPGQVQVQLH